MKKTDSVKLMKQAPKKVSFQLGDDGETHQPEKRSQTFEIKGMQIQDNTCSSSLNLLSWNTRSMSREKLQFIKQADIALLQEACWPFDKDALIFQNKYQIYIKKRLGTPLATLVIKKLICERREDHETSNSLVLQVYLSNLSIFLVNFDLISSSKRELKLITQKFENLPVIIGIDYNSTIRNFESFPYYNIFTELITRIGNNNKGRQIDYILVQKNLDVEQKFQPLLPRMSDHRQFNIKIQQKNLFQIPIIKPEQIHVYLNERNVSGIYDYLDICNKQKEFGVTYIQYDYVYNRTLSEEIEIQKPKLFSKNSIQFHKLIQHSRNLKPFKKEGSKEELDLVQQQNQQRMNGIQLTSPSKPIQLLEMGVTVSYVGDRLIKDEDMESIVKGANNFIFVFKTGETFKMDKSILKDVILSQEVSRLMGQVPPLIEQVGATLFQEMNQSLSIDECCQFASPSKKIKKDQKNQEKLIKSNKKNPRGGRGSKRSQ